MFLNLNIVFIENNTLLRIILLYEVILIYIYYFI